MSSSFPENSAQNSLIHDFYSSSFAYLNNSTYTPLTGLPSSTASFLCSKSNDEVQLAKTFANQPSNKKKEEIEKPTPTTQFSATVSPRSDQQLVEEQNRRIGDRIQINSQVEMIRVENNTKTNLNQDYQQQQQEQVLHIKKLEEDLLSSTTQNNIPVQAQATNSADQIITTSPLSRQDPEQKAIFLQETVENPYPANMEKGRESKQDEHDSSFRRKVHELGLSLLGLKYYYNRLHQHFFENSTFRSFKNQVKNEYWSPLCKVYQSLPQAVTDAKYEFTKDYSIENRTFAVATFSVIFGLVTIRSHPRSSWMSVMKKTILASAVGTFFFVPETLLFYLPNQKIQSLKSTQQSV